VKRKRRRRATTYFDVPYGISNEERKKNAYFSRVDLPVL
jgi:hypothetical protein